MNKKKFLAGRYTKTEITRLLEDLSTKYVRIQLEIEDITSIQKKLWHEYLALSVRVTDSPEYWEMATDMFSKHPRHRESAYALYIKYDEEADKITAKLKNFKESIKVLIPQRLHMRNLN